MSRRSTTPRHRGWLTRLAVGGGVAVVLLGAAVVVVLIMGRPGVSVSPARQALVTVRVSGLGAELDGVHATSAGQSVALVRDAEGMVPAAQIHQGRRVQVTAVATPPSWLRWLLGSGVSATTTVRTPTAQPVGKVAVGSKPGRIPVHFDNPVSVVSYRTGGGATQVLHLARPSTLADLPVPLKAATGSVQVAAAPLRWETIAAHSSSLTWFVVPAGSEPVALADPRPGTTTATSNGPITLTFAQPVATVLGATRPTLSPAVAGTWSEPGPNTLIFTPSGFGFGPGAAVTVAFDRSVSVEGADAASGQATTAAASSAYHFDVAPGSLLRLEQILAQLHYLPLDFTPAAGVASPTTFAGEMATMSHPLAGSFSWRWASTPATLRADWTAGASTVMVKGALMAFYASGSGYDGYQVDSETVTQLADASTWDALLHAAAADQLDPSPYSYVYVTKTSPETLTLWKNGSVVLTAAANTGIPQDPTADGTFPIYARYTVDTMSGTNPDGSHYDDIVHWVNYFNGSDAVHGFNRASYGSPQSLGCVELPVATAAKAFPDLSIGDLVTVAN